MKSTTGFFLAVILGILILTETQCNTSSVTPEIVSYSFAVPIINPPDTFQVIYNLALLGNQTAHISFQDSAVWKIEIRSQSLATFSFTNPANDSTIYVIRADTAGFKGGVKYSFTLNNSISDSTRRLYFVRFTKLPFVDYSSFSPKY